MWWDPISPLKLEGSRPEKDEELQLSTTVTVEESVELVVAVTIVLLLFGSVIMASSSSLEKSKRSSTMKWSPPPMDLLLESKEWCFSLLVNCELKNPDAP